jgi:hypothetical protein
MRPLNMTRTESTCRRNNLLDRKAPVVGFNANPLLVTGNMVAAMHDTLGRYVLLGLTAKY